MWGTLSSSVLAEVQRPGPSRIMALAVQPVRSSRRPAADVVMFAGTCTHLPTPSLLSRAYALRRGRPFSQALTARQRAVDTASIKLATVNAAIETTQAQIMKVSVNLDQLMVSNEQ